LPLFTTDGQDHVNQKFIILDANHPLSIDGCDDEIVGDDEKIILHPISRWQLPRCPITSNREFNRNAIRLNYR